MAKTTRTIGLDDDEFQNSHDFSCQSPDPGIQFGPLEYSADQADAAPTDVVALEAIIAPAPIIIESGAPFTSLTAEADQPAPVVNSLTTDQSIAPQPIAETLSLVSGAASTSDIHLLDASANALIGLDDFHGDPRFANAGIDGSGYSVVIIDTGINLSHPFFSGHIVYSYDFSGSNDTDASDHDGHGSNVASIAAGSIGVAPGANIIALKVTGDNSDLVDYTDVQEALQWVIAHGAAYNVVAVNMSFGADVNYTTPVTESMLGDEFQTLVNQGVVVAAAAGNSYYAYQTQGASDLAADPNVIGVGAVYDTWGGRVDYEDGSIAYSTRPDQITPFSQRSTNLVDFFAPGGSMTGAAATGSGTNEMDGTSQATASFTGVVALAQDMAVDYYGRKLTVAELKNYLSASARSLYDGGTAVDDNVAHTGEFFKRIDFTQLAIGIAGLPATSLTGGTGNDVLSATEKSILNGLQGDDTLTGSSVSDTLFGQSENDLLDGRGGADTMVGYYGDDTFIVDNAGDIVGEFFGGGTDTVQSSVSFTIPTDVEILILTGSANINATGGGNVDTLFGNSGNNALNGGGGADSMAGGAGNDTYYVDDAGDTVVESSGAGSADREVSVLTSTTIAANIEVLQLGGTGNSTAFGSSGTDTLIGNSGNNLLDGAGGSDTMIGGLGDDTYVIDGASDKVTESAGPPTVPSGWAIKGAVDFDHDGDVDVVVTNGTSANELWLYQNGTAATVKSLVGFTDRNADGWADLLFQETATGRQQVDFYMGGTTRTGTTSASGLTADPIAAVNEGTDTVLASVSYTLGNGVENLTLATGAGAINGTGNGLANIIIGNESDNTLAGLGGVDTLTGGNGADVFAFDDGETGAAVGQRDRITDFTPGTDKLDLAAIDANSTTAADNAFRFLGTLGFDGQAGALHYAYDGTRNVTVVSGDTNGDGTADFAIELSGNLTLASGDFATGSLLAPIVQTGGTGTDTLTGGEVDDTLNGAGGTDTLLGFAGSDTLDGGSGADTMLGGLGNDTYVVDNAGDVVTEVAGAPTVPSGWTLKGAVDFDHDGDVDVVVTNGTSANELWLYQNGTVATVKSLGFWPDWHLVGFTDRNADGWADLLFQETATGRQQVDFYMGGTTRTGTTSASGLTADPIAAVNEGTDTVQASVNYTLGNGVENLTMLTGALVDTGNGLANIITGNGDGNTLFGLGGADTLDGGSGADTMVGGQGNDTYMVDNAGDVVTEIAGAPSVPSGWTIKGAADFNHDGQVDVLVTNGTSANQLWLMNGDTVTTVRPLGFYPDWHLVGFTDRNSDGWADIIFQETATGRQQIDLYQGGASRIGYVTTSGVSPDAVPASEGTDTVHASVSYALPTAVENLTLDQGAGAIDGTGNASNNTIVGNDSTNTITGGAGADTLWGDAVGGSGSTSDDRFVFAPGSGADMIMDFTAGGTIDEIDVVSFGFGTFASLMGHAQLQGGNTVISLAPGDTLTLVGVSPAQLQAGDFII